MEKVILTMFLAASIAFGQGGDAQKGPSSQAKVLTRAEFDALLAKPEQILLLDVRRPDEITNNGGFPAYLSIQFAELEKNLAWIPRDRMIVAVSNHAGRGGQAADLLARHGFKVAGTIGAQVYETQGGKLTKIVPPAPANNK